MKTQQGEERWIPASKLKVVWPESQRPQHSKDAREIARDFDFDLFGRLTVSSELQEGIYHIIDGQTRKEGACLRFGNDIDLPCIVTTAKTKAECARIFRGMNGKRSLPKTIDMFKTGVTEGCELEVAVNNILTALGLKVATNANDGSIRAIGTVLSIHKQYGGMVLHNSLYAIRETWGFGVQAYDAIILQGFARFLYENPNVSIARLAKKVAKDYRPADFISLARSRRMKGEKAGVSGCEILVTAHNKHLQKK